MFGAEVAWKRVLLGSVFWLKYRQISPYMYIFKAASRFPDHETSLDSECLFLLQPDTVGRRPWSRR